MMRCRLAALTLAHLDCKWGWHHIASSSCFQHEHPWLLPSLALFLSITLGILFWVVHAKQISWPWQERTRCINRSSMEDLTWHSFSVCVCVSVGVWVWVCGCFGSTISQHFFQDVRRKWLFIMSSLWVSTNCKKNRLIRALLKDQMNQSETTSPGQGCLCRYLCGNLYEDRWPM